jgi:hypothetical protein
MITIDGKQQDGDYSVEETKDILKKNAGKHLLVWTVGMAQWADPAGIPEFRKMPTKQVEATEKETRPKVSSEEIKEQAGVFKGLLDFRFQNLIATKIIPIVYVLTLLLILLGGLFYFFVFGGGTAVSGIRLRSAALILTGLAIMVATPLLMLLYIAFVRIWCESVLVFFRIKDDVGQIATRSSSGTSEKK